MANSVSSKKRIRQNESHRARNRWRKRKIRVAIKDYDELILHGDIEQTRAKLQELYKLVDQIAATGTIHKNARDRTKARLAARLNRKLEAAAA